MGDTPPTEAGELALRQFGALYDRNDLPGMREHLTRHPEIFQVERRRQFWLRQAAAADNVGMMALFVEFGGDIHQPKGTGSPPAPEGVIEEAAHTGAVTTARWLLDHGAKINFRLDEFPGESRCMPLTHAIIGGHLELVKLLVERGADINANWGGYTPLSYAVMYGKKEIESYLRSRGALEPDELKKMQQPS
jgi:hypothetical protein